MCKALRPSGILHLWFIALFTTPMCRAFAQPAPGVSGMLSIVPGLGQVANGNTLEGLGYFSATLGLMAANTGIARNAGSNLWMYNMYDAYRDAGPKRKTNYSLFENYIANFNPMNAIDPIGASFLGVGIASGGKSKLQRDVPRSKAGRALYYTFTGTGEEALFRGFLYPGFSDLTRSTIAGALISSVIFSAAHRQGGGPFVVRSIMGMLFCWQVQRNQYDLRKSIFAHSWFDFSLSTKGLYEASVQFKFLY